MKIKDNKLKCNNSLDFRDYYTFEIFKLEINLIIRYNNYNFDIVQSKFIDYLKTLAKNNILKISDSKHHKTNITKIFNSLLNNELSDIQKVDLEYFFSQNLILGGGLFLYDKCESLETLYEEFINYVNSGNFDYYNFNNDRCFYCDSVIYYKFEN